MQIKKNLIYNSINVLSQLVFPLLILGYLSKVFGSKSMGTYYFIVNFVSYFTLFSMSAISVYAVRSGSKIRDNISKISTFFYEILIINLILTMVLISIYLILIFNFSFFKDYQILYFIQLIVIVSSSILIDWFVIVYEDFKFILIRNVITQLITLSFIVFVLRERESLALYLLIVSLLNLLSNILTFLKCKKKLVNITLHQIDLTRHLKSLLMFFTGSIASSIYLNLDIVIIGILLNESSVAIYASGVKIYRMLLSIFIMIIGTLIPTINYSKSKDPKEFESLINKTIEFTVIFLVPAIIGVIVFSDQIVHVIFGDEFIMSVIVLRLLTPVLLLSIFNNLMANLIILPNNLDKVNLLAMLIASIVNTLINLVLIPRFGILTAVFTTFISELIVFMYFYSKSIHYHKPRIEFVAFVKYSIISLSFILVRKAFNFEYEFSFIKFFSSIISCIMIYFVFLWFLKDKTLLLLLKNVKGIDENVKN